MGTLISKPISTRLHGTVAVPGDKSIGHRSLLFGALADEPVVIRGLSDGADNRNTWAAMAAMGVPIAQRDDGTVRIEGVGLRGLRAPGHDLDCGNSGTTMRLLSGLLAGQSFASRLTGDASLSRRPMRRVTEPLGAMGAAITGREVDGKLTPPLVIEPVPQLRGIRYEQPMASAQVKSALVLAGLYAQGVTEVVEPGQSRDHTEIMLRAMGAPVSVSGHTITVRPEGWNGRLCGGNVTVPGDPSSAAFVVVAALIAGADRVTVTAVGTNPRRCGFLDAVADFGAKVQIEAAPSESGEPTGNLVVAGTCDGLSGFVVAGDLTVRSIDELPILAILAARAHGDSQFLDAGELRAKESDRIASTSALLRALGVAVEEQPEGFIVAGNGGRPFRGARIDADGDHRLAMAAAVAGLVAEGPVVVDNAEVVATSFPSFTDVMNSLGANVSLSS